jgi:hypothetical protein
MVAAGKGRLEEARMLLDAGADPALSAKNGFTARDWAAKFGHGELAAFLDGRAQVGGWGGCLVMWHQCGRVCLSGMRARP